MQIIKWDSLSPGIQQKKLVNFKYQFDYFWKTGYVVLYINIKIQNYLKFSFWLAVPTIDATHVNQSLNQMSEIPIDCSSISTRNSLIRLSVPQFPKQANKKKPVFTYIQTYKHGISMF